MPAIIDVQEVDAPGADIYGSVPTGRLGPWDKTTTVIGLGVMIHRVTQFHIYIRLLLL